MANRQYDELHKDHPFHDGSFPDDPKQWSKDYSIARPFHFRDGVTIWVSPEDMTPEDDFLGQSLGSEKSDGEVGESADEPYRYRGDAT